VPSEPRTVKFEFVPAKRSGDVVVDFKDLAKAWTKPDGSPHPVFGGATGTVVRGQKVAVTGVNGAGKSTFLKVLTGQTEPTAGACTLGASVQMAYFSQYSSDILKADRTILDEVQERLPQASVGAIKTVLGSFLFTGDDAEKRISVLSGGEKSRVMLACLLAQPVNFIVLDEPTNHLDITSREVLLEALQEFDGTVLIVSHDRFFLKHLVNRVIEVDHGALKTYEGDYDYYLEKASRA
jgi:ATP-binding cassette subfamily F protein 3